ncbi:hypothetical protein Pfo_014580 [Paulownia fortunei]|nr:hypothetical protein Pfo_014580 [Paulownia fortunei]
MEVKKKWITDARVPLGMLVVQVINTGLQILSRVILSEGTFIFALMTYRHVVAALSMVPFALYWKDKIKKIEIKISMAMGLFYYGLKDTTAAYATNFLNLFQIETLGVRSRAGKIKVLGAMLCLAGALTIVLYKGKSFHISHYHEPKSIKKTKQNKTRGTMFLVGSCLSYGIWFILQVKLFKVFPHKYWATLLTCVIASVQGTVIGLCMDRKPKDWRLGWNLQLVTIFYSGILATGASFSLISWVITQKGPTYPSMFNPLGLILVTITEALFLGEEISVGSLIGMALIVVGLYSFLWGKHEDMKAKSLPPKERGRGGGDALGAEPESAGLQSSATIVPAASLNSD